MTSVNLLWMGVAGLRLMLMAWTEPVVKLRGDRFRPLTYEQMTPPQKAMIDHLLSGDRGGSTEGPFNVFLRSP